MSLVETHKQLNVIEIIQNPALSAYLLWRFGLAFQSEKASLTPFPLFFLVLPLLLHRPTLEMISSTNPTSGLALFTAKLGKDRENLLAVHERALELRQLTFEAISLAVQGNLITINYEEATIRANMALAKDPAVPERLKSLVKGANKIGGWFSRLTINQIASILKVNF